MENGFFNGEGGLIILILFFLMMGGNGFWGNNGRGDYATGQQLYETANAQGVNAKIDNVTQAINNSIFQNTQDTAHLMQSLNCGFDQINANISQLGFNMQQCCCDLKTQMLQDKYDAVRYQLEQANTAVANAVQTQNILGSLGRYVPYSGYNPPLLSGTTVV